MSQCYHGDVQGSRGAPGPVGPPGPRGATVNDHTSVITAVTTFTREEQEILVPQVYLEYLGKLVDQVELASQAVLVNQADW